MSTFSITPFGDPNVTYKMLQNIDLLFNSANTFGQIQELAVLGGVIGIIVACIRAIPTQKLEIQYVVLAIIIYLAFLVPQVSLEVRNKDFNGSLVGIVHVPIGIAASATILSAVSDGAANLIQEYITSADGWTYTPLDSINILQKLRSALMNGSISGATLQHNTGNPGVNIPNYITECWIPDVNGDAANGPQRVNAALNDSPLIDQLYSQWPWGMMKWYDAGGVQSVTCPQAYQKLLALGQNATTSQMLMKYLAEAVVGEGDSQGQQTLQDAYSGAVQNIVGAGADANKFMLNLYLRESLVAAAKGDAITGQSMAFQKMLTDAMESRAVKSSADVHLWGQMIWKYATFFEVLTYCMMPFLAFLMFMGRAGISLFFKYIGLLAWVALWNPIGAIVNSFMGVAFHSGLSTALTTSGLTNFQSMQGQTILYNAVTQWMTVGNNMMISVPFLSLFAVTASVYTANNLVGKLGYERDLSTSDTVPTKGSVSYGNTASTWSAGSATQLMSQVGPQSMSDVTDSFGHDIRLAHQQTVAELQQVAQASTKQTQSEVMKYLGFGTTNTSGTKGSISSSQGHTTSTANSTGTATRQGQSETFSRQRMATLGAAIAMSARNTTSAFLVNDAMQSYYKENLAPQSTATAGGVKAPTDPQTRAEWYSHALSLHKRFEERLESGDLKNASDQDKAKALWSYVSSDPLIKKYGDPLMARWDGVSDNKDPMKTFSEAVAISSAASLLPRGKKGHALLPDLTNAVKLGFDEKQTTAQNDTASASVDQLQNHSQGETTDTGSKASTSRDASTNMTAEDREGMKLGQSIVGSWTQQQVAREEESMSAQSNKTFGSANRLDRVRAMKVLASNAPELQRVMRDKFGYQIGRTLPTQGASERQRHDFARAAYKAMMQFAENNQLPEAEYLYHMATNTDGRNFADFMNRNPTMKPLTQEDINNGANPLKGVVRSDGLKQRVNGEMNTPFGRGPVPKTALDAQQTQTRGLLKTPSATIVANGANRVTQHTNQTLAQAGGTQYKPGPNPTSDKTPVVSTQAKNEVQQRQGEDGLFGLENIPRRMMEDIAGVTAGLMGVQLGRNLKRAGKAAQAKRDALEKTSDYLKAEGSGDQTEIAAKKTEAARAFGDSEELKGEFGTLGNFLKKTGLNKRFSGFTEAFDRFKERNPNTWAEKMADHIPGLKAAMKKTSEKLVASGAADAVPLAGQVVSAVGFALTAQSGLDLYQGIDDFLNKDNFINEGDVAQRMGMSDTGSETNQLKNGLEQIDSRSGLFNPAPNSSTPLIEALNNDALANDPVGFYAEATLAGVTPKGMDQATSALKDVPGMSNFVAAGEIYSTDQKAATARLPQNSGLEARIPDARYFGQTIRQSMYNIMHAEGKKNPGVASSEMKGMLSDALETGKLTRADLESLNPEQQSAAEQGFTKESGFDSSWYARTVKPLLNEK